MKPIYALVSALTATIALAAVPAHAGEKASQPVSIDTFYRYATGALGSARNSADGIQSIACGVFSSTTTATYVSCSARTAKGAGAWCTSTAPALVQAAAGIGTDSAITFWWDKDGSCTRLEVFNGSNTEPKQP